MMQINPTR